MTHRVQRALLSAYDKQGIVELARSLVELDIAILSSGGTARKLAEAGIPVTRVSDHTGFPEMLDGRVKTLHPRIHAGILAARDNPEHLADLERAEIPTIDLVVVNLYPFRKTASREGIGFQEVVEMIDIGGPTMIRAAAKNFDHVGVVVDPSDYAALAEELRGDHGLSAATRQRLAVKAFRHTATYDAAIHAYLDRVDPATGAVREASEFDEQLSLELDKVQDLRYGENPHQRAAFYREPLDDSPSVARSRQLQGKELSFNNILDLDAALAVVLDFDEGACAIIKHGNPCGCATASAPRDAFDRALECDPVSAFGGVIAFNRRVDDRAAEAIAAQFYEAVIAPGFDHEALARLAKKKKLRLLECGTLPRTIRPGRDYRRVAGGMLVQDADRIVETVRESRVVTTRMPTDDEWRAMQFAWTVARHVKSNAIVYAAADRTLGVGAGQMSRVDSAKIGVEKARVPLVGAAMASDAFFPFRDGIDAAAAVGITTVVQPGGSIRDDEVIAAADEHGMAMVFTGRRHFRH